ncbi:MAG: HNH endonuclease [Alphaproteobacteria bacterium]
MAKGVFIHNPGTQYDDDPATQYHFPKMYLKRVEATIGDNVLFYQSGPKGGYTATATVANIVPDPKNPNTRYYANILPRSYTPFSRNVPFRLNGKLANSFLDNGDGTANRGKQVWAVRPISEEDYLKIVALAAADVSELPRFDNADFEVGEFAPEPFIFDAERVTIGVLLNQKVRSRLFRERVISTYDKQCALTGMRLINGGGRAEVQAAHIKSVQHNGPDSVNNGIALSGTIHWMFDRGLLSVSNEYEILISRKVNNTEEVDRLINKDRRVILPKRSSDWPHPQYLDWHRRHHNFEAA